MDPRPSARVRDRRVRFSPYLLAVALTPALMQQQLTCSGDTTLSVLELEVSGENQIAFDPQERSYAVTLPPGTAVLVAESTDPAAKVSYNLSTGGPPPVDSGVFPVGGGEVTFELPEGESTLRIYVNPPGGAPGSYQVHMNVGALLPCTEQGIRDAIALGGGIHRFDCDGPTTVFAEAEMVIDNDVILDGEGNLTVESQADRNDNPYRVFSVESGFTVGLVGMTIAGGSFYEGDGAGIYNAGKLSLENAVVRNNSSLIGTGGGIHNGGELLLKNTVVRNNGGMIGGGGGGIYNGGTAVLIESQIISNAARSGGGGISSSGNLTLVDTTVSDNSSEQAAGISSSGALTLIRSTVARNDGFYRAAGISSTGPTTLVNSTLSDNTHYFGAQLSITTLSMWNCTVVGDGALIDGQVRAANSVFFQRSPGPNTPQDACQDTVTIISAGGNIESPGDTCGLTDPTDQVNVSAAELNLGPLADNGGPTETHALGTGSAAIDQNPAEDCVDADGAPLTTDQRGEPRPAGDGCDVGAFEVQP